jgi:cell division septation protein DedD
MAVLTQRKPPRIFLSSTRLRRSMTILGAVLAFSSSALMLAQAQEGGALSSGAASFSAGKYDVAVRQLTTAINSEGLSPENAAKALYYRGLAYQRLGQSGRAISDLGAAMWLGLSASERVSALVNRSLAYRAAGLSSQAESELAAARKLGGSGEVDQLLAQSGTSPRETAAIAAFSTEVRAEQSRPEPIASATPATPPPAQTANAADPSSWSTTAPTATEQPSSGSRLSRMWSGLRGRPTEAPPAAAASVPAPAPQATASAWTTRTETARSEPEAAPSTWSTQVARSDAAPAESAASGARYAAATPAAQASGGAYRLQLSPTRSEAEAQALWKTVSSQNRQIASLTPSIEKTDMGNLGTFYRLQIGPFPDKAESLKVCNALKRSGVDCFLVGP